VTLRGVASSFAVVPGEVAPEDGWAGLAAVDTLVVLMGVRRRGNACFGGTLQPERLCSIAEYHGDVEIQLATIDVIDE
jgi:hypothetical protein